MRAIKRVRYSEKELKRLNDLVTKNELKEQTAVKDIVMKTNEAKEEPMVTNESEVKRSSKTLRDQFGHYPQWMNQRQVKRLKNRLKTSVKRLKRK